LLNEKLTTEATVNHRGHRSMVYERLTAEILRAAFKVHTALGPGLLERPYRKCLEIDLRRSIAIETETAFPIS
jgi:hypothetical protein